MREQPALIGGELWEQVNAKLARQGRNQRGLKHSHQDALLLDLLRCGDAVPAGCRPLQPSKASAIATILAGAPNAESASSGQSGPRIWLFPCCAAWKPSWGRPTWSQSSNRLTGSLHRSGAGGLDCAAGWQPVDLYSACGELERCSRSCRLAHRGGLSHFEELDYARPGEIPISCDSGPLL